MKKLDTLLIYQKAMHLVTSVHSLMSVIPEEDEYLQSSKGMMMEDAMIIASKIAGAEGGDLYSIRMQNAAIIRSHAMHLYTQIGSLRFHESFKDVEYVALLRQDLDEFRLLLIEWITSFDTNNHIWDDWGMFNPPGAIPPNDSYDDPLNSDDFIGDDE